jgi:hypothetical protein
MILHSFLSSIETEAKSKLLFIFGTRVYWRRWEFYVIGPCDMIVYFILVNPPTPLFSPDAGGPGFFYLQRYDPTFPITIPLGIYGVVGWR